MPVLPLVGSTITERPRSIRPSLSAASIIATPIRSLTEPPGLKYSSFAQTWPGRPAPSRSSSTLGVLPTTADASPPILIGPSLGRAGPTRSSGRAAEEEVIEARVLDVAHPRHADLR